MSDVEHSENEEEVSMASTKATQQRYNDIVAHIEREQTLINNRITWMLTFEGFLFAGLALISDTKQSPQVRNALKDVLPLVGGSVAGLTVFGVLAATLSIMKAKKFWENQTNKEEFGPGYGSRWASYLGRVTSFGVPLAVAAAWVAILVKLR
jgi:hypothetical protein